MKGKAKKSWLLRCLLALALVTSLTSASTLAKYASHFSVSTSAEVAAFAGGGTVSFDADLEGITPSQPRSMTFTVQNYEGEKNSDVQLDYTIRVETTGNLPLAFSLVGQTGEIADDNKPAGALTRQGGNVWVWEAKGGVLPIASEKGKKQHSYELTASWSSDAAKEDYSHEVDMVTVTVTTTQTDPNGAKSE